MACALLLSRGDSANAPASRRGVRSPDICVWHQMVIEPINGTRGIVVLDPRRPSARCLPSYELGRRVRRDVRAARARPRAHCRPLFEDLRAASRGELGQRQHEADKAFLTQGITFTVYGDEQGTERIFPFDLLPRIITAPEWQHARARADAAADGHQPVPEGRVPRGRILAEGVVPRDLVQSCRHYRREMRGVPRAPATSTCRSPAPIWSRLEDGRFVVLEDNLRVPSGVSYMLANREVTKRVLPGAVRSVSRRARSRSTGRLLLATLRALAPPDVAGADLRGAHAGRRQLGVLRARVPRPRDGRRARRRTRPAGARQLRLHADDGRTAARGRDLPPRRRRLPRSAGVSDRLAPGRRGSAERLPRRQRVDRQRHRHRARRRQGALRLHPGDHPLLSVARSRSCSNVETYLLANPVRPAVRPRASRRAGRQGGGRVGRLRDAHRSAQHGDGARGVQGEDPCRPAQLHRPADAGALARAVFHRRPASSRGTWTCGRTSCSATA